MNELLIDRDLLALKDLPKRKPARADWHNYNAGKYFVTVCTRDMHCSFGHIEDREMTLYKIGMELAAAIEDMPSHFNDVEVIEYVVMPNHFHAIIHISDGLDFDCEVTSHYNNRLAVAVGCIKARVTRFARKHNLTFKWQRGFHDRVIRTRDEYRDIRNYIIGNVTRWSDDKFHR